MDWGSEEEVGVEVAGEIQLGGGGEGLVELEVEVVEGRGRSDGRSEEKVSGLVGPAAGGRKTEGRPGTTAVGERLFSLPDNPRSLVVNPPTRSRSSSSSDDERVLRTGGAGATGAGASGEEGRG